MRPFDRIRARVRDPHRATSMSHLDPCEQYPPTSPLCVAAAEAAIELPLPQLLHKIYTQIGNGGVGPAWGVLGVEGSPHAYTWSHTSPPQPLGLIGIYYGGSGAFGHHNSFRFVTGVVPIGHVLIAASPKHRSSSMWEHAASCACKAPHLRRGWKHG